MIIKKEITLSTFEFWAGALQHKFTNEELDTLENILESLSAEEPIYSETDINDLFWHEGDYLCELLELDFEEYENR